jgi:hypothetical protein
MKNGKYKKNPAETLSLQFSDRSNKIFFFGIFEFINKHYFRKTITNDVYVFDWNNFRIDVPEEETDSVLSPSVGKVVRPVANQSVLQIDKSALNTSLALKVCSFEYHLRQTKKGFMRKHLG